MELIKNIEEDFKQALKQRSPNLDTLKALRSSIKNKEIEFKRELLIEEDIIEIIRKEIKKRFEAQEIYQKGDRKELAEKEKAEAEFLKKYLPEDFSNNKIEEIVDKTIKELEATGKQDFGKVMGKVMQEVKGRAEGNMVKKIVEEKLS